MVVLRRFRIGGVVDCLADSGFPDNKGGEDKSCGMFKERMRFEAGLLPVGVTGIEVRGEMDNWHSCRKGFSQNFDLYSS